MRRFAFRWLLGLAAFATLAPVAIAVIPTRKQGQALDKPANERMLRDAQGRRIVEYLWPLGTPDHIVKLRIPADYIWFGGAGLKAALGPGYPDPDVVGPFTTTIILEMLLPDLEPRTSQNEAIFRARPVLRPMTASIRTTARAKPPNNGRGIIGTSFERMKHMVENEARREYGMDFGPKPDRWGLKHLGARGDFEPFRERWGPDDIYYTDDEPMSTTIVCRSEEIKEEEEDPSWKRHQNCKHYFYSYFLGATVDLFYSRRYMREWRDLEIRLESLFRSFKIVEYQDRSATGAAADLAYPAKVSLDRGWIGVDRRREAIRPEMRVSAEIRAGEWRVIEYLLSPAVQAVPEAGREQ